VPWLDRPLGDRALAVRAACLKGYYLELTATEGVNAGLREELSAVRLPSAAARDRSFLGHLAWPAPVNPLLSSPGPPRRHPRMPPEGAAAALLESVRTARDKMIVTWLADSGMRIGELCGLWFSDLHLVAGHGCGERAGPHAHVVRRFNPNGARAKTARPAALAAGMVTGGTVRRASPATVAAYHEYLAGDYYRVRALACHDMVLVQLAGERAGEPLSAHGARQMLERAGRRAGLGLVTPHAFRHAWATALTAATGGNTKAVADEGERPRQRRPRRGRHAARRGRQGHRRAAADRPGRRAGRGERMVAFFGCMYYAALRPEEAVDLRRDNLTDLPDDGWGEMLLTHSEPRSGTSWTDNRRARQRRELKHRAPGETRTVPIHPELVILLRDHLKRHGTGPGGRIFIGPRGGILTDRAYLAVFHQARAAAFTGPEAASLLARRPYDLRHAAVSTWLNARVAPPQVADWAGHSVHVLLRVYAKCISGQQDEAKRRILEATQPGAASDKAGPAS